MNVSEARLAANRANAARSTGPTSPEGKAISRQNGLKHGLTGRGVVTPEGDAEEIRRRVEEFTADMKPRSPAGAVLIERMATLSVRAERAVRQESAAIALRVRHAADDFDEERIEQADRLFEGLADDPRGTLRKLKKSPEGVDRLLDAWRDLRDDLAIDPEPIWTAGHLERAANLTGLKARHARGSELGVLSRGFWGEADADGLDEPFRKEWAKSMLLERIDAEIAELEAHYETLDFETIERDRAGAADRALFDPSKPATLARRYESEASRGFFKALKEFHQVEAESQALAEAESPQPEPAEPPRPELRMGSCRETAPSPDQKRARSFPEAPRPDNPALRGPDGQPLPPIPLAKSPG